MNEVSYRVVLEKNQDKTREQFAVANMLSYYEKHKPHCQMVYRDFLKNRKKKFSDYPSRVTVKQFKKLVGQDAILVCTATEIENYVYLSQLSQAKKILSYWVGGDEFHVCHYDNSTTLVHIHQKNTGANYARIAVDKAFSVFRPKAVVLLGICYGMDEKEQKLTEVCVANRVDCFRLDIRDKKIEPAFETLYYPNKPLISTIQEAMAWYSPPKVGQGSSPETISIRFGRFVSVNCLISNFNVKADIVRACGIPKPIAGEMEACGALSTEKLNPPHPTTNYLRAKWLVIKSVSDWGVLKNGLSSDKSVNEEIKSSVQLLAMRNTWDLFSFMLDRELLTKGGCN